MTETSSAPGWDVIGDEADVAGPAMRALVYASSQR